MVKARHVTVTGGNKCRKLEGEGRAVSAQQEGGGGGECRKPIKGGEVGSEKNNKGRKGGSKSMQTRREEGQRVQKIRGKKEDNGCKKKKGRGASSAEN